MTAKYEHVATITLDSSASSVTFSSIPQGYRDLELILDVSFSPENGVEIRLNSDTGSNYSRSAMYGGAQDSFARATSGTNAYLNLAVSDYTNFHGRIELLDYSATDKHKTVLARINNLEWTVANALRWASTSAITNLEVLGGTFTAGSTFDLYGIVGGA